MKWILLLGLFLGSEAIAQPYRFLDGQTVFGQPVIPDPSAIFQIEGTNRGFLPPRLTTTQRDNLIIEYTSLPVGLQIYNTTTNAIESWNGASWSSSLGGVTGSGEEDCLPKWLADGSPILLNSFFCTDGSGGLFVQDSDNPLDDIDMTLAGANDGRVVVETGFSVETTTASSRPCPSMTTTQRDALTPVASDCIWNSSIPQLQIYDGSAWGSVGGGGLDPWETSFDYEIGDVVYVTHDSFDRIYVANTAHTSGTFATDIANWDLLADASVTNTAGVVDIEGIEISANQIENTTVNTDLDFLVDGTGIFTFNSDIDATGDVSGGNLSLSGNSLISTDTDGDITLNPNGTGDVIVDYLTANGVVFSGAGGALADDSAFTFNATTDTLTIDNVDISGSTVETRSANADLVLQGHGTGGVQSNDNLEVVGTTTMGDLVIGDGSIGQTGALSIVSDTSTTVTGDLFVESGASAEVLHVNTATDSILVDENLEITDDTVESLVGDLTLTGNDDVLFNRGSVNYLVGSKNPELGNKMISPSFEEGVTDFTTTNASVAQQASNRHGTQAARCTTSATDGYCQVQIDVTSLADLQDIDTPIQCQVKSVDDTWSFETVRDGSVVDSIELGDITDWLTITTSVVSGSTGVGFRVTSTANGDVIDIDDCKIAPGQLFPQTESIFRRETTLTVSDNANFTGAAEMVVTREGNVVTIVTLNGGIAHSSSSSISSDVGFLPTWARPQDTMDNEYNDGRTIRINTDGSFTLILSSAATNSGRPTIAYSVQDSNSTPRSFATYEKNIRSEIVDLSGDAAFTTGSLLVTKVGSQVSISELAEITHPSGNSITSSTVLIPDWARPPRSQSNSIVSITDHRTFSVLTDGTVNFRYRNGDLTANANRTGPVLANISYNVDDGSQTLALLAEFKPDEEFVTGTSSGAITQPFDLKLSRRHNDVMAYTSTARNTASASNVVTYPAGTLPERFRPLTEKVSPVLVFTDGATQAGFVRIATDGGLSFFRSTENNFSGSTSVGRAENLDTSFAWRLD